MAAKPPPLLLLVQHHHHFEGPTLPPTSLSSSVLIHHPSLPSSSKSPIDFSPPLIAMVVVAAAAFLFITYSRLISRHLFPPLLRLLRRPSSPPPPYQSSDGFYVYSPRGLDDSVIKNIPLTIYNNFPSSKVGYFELDGYHDCAVCLLDFQDGDYIRTLPQCFHPFHIDCIDMWLRSHATCPLCRAGVYLSPSPHSPLLSPVMAARIRPSFDRGILFDTVFLEVDPSPSASGEIQEVEVYSPETRVIQSEDHRSNRRELDFLLKRSYSFGFERSYRSEAAITPYQRRSTKRASTTPFRSRVFSFRRTPAFFRRRGFIPVTESESSRRMKASPLFGTMFSSSRMRLGDPEALISPERYNRR